MRAAIAGSTVEPLANTALRCTGSPEPRGERGSMPVAVTKQVGASVDAQVLDTH